MRAQSIQNMDKMTKGQHKEETFALAQEHIDFLAAAPVVWDPSESGAPIIEPESLYKSGIKGVHTALQIVLRFATIEPGTYSIPNRLKQFYKETAIEIDGQRIEIPQEDQITFQLTEQHIKMLRKANAESITYFGACGINSRAPYGETSIWEIDVAHILGVPVYRDQNGSPSFTEEEIALFHKLHHEMLFALPVFLAHAKIEPGKFVRVACATPAWERVQPMRHTGSKISHRLLRIEGKQLRLRGNW